MLFRIAKENQERAGKAFTVEREKNNFGYKKSGILKPKSNRIMHYYEVDMIDADRIICTVRHKNNDCIVALVWLSGYTPDFIEVDQAELYRNCSNYPYRREYNEKYLKKYDQIACIVHGAIAAGLLFDTVEAPTTEETSEAGQDTACTDTEPQEGTETAQKATDMATFCAAYRAAYTALYDHCGEPATDEKERYYCALFDQEAEAIADTVRRFCAYRGDLVSSDREAAAFMIALEAVGAPTDGETATDGETTTTTETKPQRATEPPKKAIQTGERLYSHPHRHMVIVEGLQGDLVRVIYKGRLYLVCSSDLYTDEAETTPAQMENDTTSATEGTQEGAQTAGTSEGTETTTPPHTKPPRATERAATGGSVSQTSRRTRPAAPQSHGTTKGIQRHHRPPKTAYKAIQSAAPFSRRRVTTSHQDRRKVTFSAWMYKTGSDPPKI